MTEVLIHFDGADESTTFTDESGKVWTANVNAQLDTAYKQFGTASGLFPDGNSDLTTPNHLDLAPGTGDFTIDCWIKTGALSSYNHIWDARTSDPDANGFSFGIRSSMALNLWTANGFRIETATKIVAATWTHIALVRNGDVHRIFINGVADINTWTNASDYSNQIGLIAGYFGGGQYGFIGHVDEFRVSKGIDRTCDPTDPMYNGTGTPGDSFTPPPAAYTADVTVVADILSIVAYLSGSPMVGLAAPVFTAQGNMSAGLYTGAWVTTGPFSVSGTLETPTFSISLGSQAFLDPVVLSGSPQFGLLATALSATGSIDAGNIFAGPIIASETFGLSGLLSADLGIIVAAQLLVTKTLNASLLVGLALPSLSIQGMLSESQISIITLLYPVRRYFFTLIGAADGKTNITIPISSFQTRMKSGDPTFLSVVIPGVDYSAQISARSNGQLVIKMGYEVGGVVELAEELARVDLENIRIDEGGTNKSISLDGHRTVTYLNKAVDLIGASYRNLTKGKLRYRCEPDLYLRPGDTVTISSDTFVADNITMSISPGNETMEVLEA